MSGIIEVDCIARIGGATNIALGYDKYLAIGTICARFAGAPTSINRYNYLGLIADTSIIKLFTALIIPGLCWLGLMWRTSLSELS